LKVLGIITSVRNQCILGIVYRRVENISSVIDRVFVIPSLEPTMAQTHVAAMLSTKDIINLPSSRPTKTRIDRISQIEFRLNRPDDSPMINVHARNTRLNEEYLWRSMPSTYESDLQRALYKLELLKMVAARSDIDRLHYLSALKYLVYMDKTLDRIWEEVEIAVDNNEMSLNWRCPTLERWALIECNVYR
jgi:hypothetical protein